MRVTCRLLQRAAKALEQYSQYNPLPLSIKKFIEFGSNGKFISYLPFDLPPVYLCINAKES